MLLSKSARTGQNFLHSHHTSRVEAAVGHADTRLVPKATISEDLPGTWKEWSVPQRLNSWDANSLSSV